MVELLAKDCLLPRIATIPLASEGRRQEHLHDVRSRLNSPSRVLANGGAAP